MKPGATTPVFRVALYEGAGAQPLAAEYRAQVLKALLEKGYAVTCIRPGAVVTHSTEGRLLVLGQFTESKPSEAQDDTGKIALHFRPIDNLDPAQTAALVDQVRDEWNVPKPGSWKPWFPVIDYGRCTNCMQCLSFCLFDVYGVNTEGKIKVQKAQNCKTDCPACSRVCPEVAILFPKYKSGPINGDQVKAEDLQLREDEGPRYLGLLLGRRHLRSAASAQRWRESPLRQGARRKTRPRRTQKMPRQAPGAPLDIPAEVMNAKRLQWNKSRQRPQRRWRMQSNSAEARIKSASAENRGCHSPRLIQSTCSYKSGGSVPRVDSIRSELQRLIRSVPFRRFVLSLENGERAVIEHPENVAFDPEASGTEDVYIISGKLRLFLRSLKQTSPGSLSRRPRRRGGVTVTLGRNAVGPPQWSFPMVASPERFGSGEFDGAEQPFNLTHICELRRFFLWHGFLSRGRERDKAARVSVWESPGSCRDIYFFSANKTCKWSGSSHT